MRLHIDGFLKPIVSQIKKKTKQIKAAHVFAMESLQMLK